MGGARWARWGRRGAHTCRALRRALRHTLPIAWRLAPNAYLRSTALPAPARPHLDRDHLVLRHAEAVAVRHALGHHLIHLLLAGGGPLAAVDGRQLLLLRAQCMDGAAAAWEGGATTCMQHRRPWCTSTCLCAPQAVARPPTSPPTCLPPTYPPHLCILLHRLQLLVSAEAGVGLALSHQLVHVLPVHLLALRLAVGAVGAAHVGACARGRGGASGGAWAASGGRPGPAAAAAATSAAATCSWAIAGQQSHPNRALNPPPPRPPGAPSSHWMPSHLRSVSTASSLSRVLRAASVSSTRSTSLPPTCLAKSQLKSAVRAPPTCRLPVGDGAKRTRTSRPSVSAPAVFGLSSVTAARALEWRARRPEGIGCTGAKWQRLESGGGGG